MQWGLYAVIFFAPFVQEDAAIVGAASASLGPADPALAFVTLVIGLILSDVWKYWLGRAAHAFAWTRNAAERPDVLAAREKVLKRLGVTLLIARFVPGTRIPLYLAAGVFKAPFGRFAFFVISSGLLYCGIVFAAFHALGAVIGEQARAMMPWIAMSVVFLVLGFQGLRFLLRRQAARAQGLPPKPDSPPG